MRIKITAGELMMASRVLGDLASTKMPVGVGYQVARLAQTLQKEIRLVSARQGEVMTRHKAKKGDDGGLVLTPKDPGYAKATAEIKELFSQAITIEADIVSLPKSVVLEPRTLLVLEKFLKVS